MNIVHISKEDQENVFAMVSAVLWLGDVSFTVIDNENHVEIIVDEGKLNHLIFTVIDTPSVPNCRSFWHFKVHNFCYASRI
jgi:hypothetical protein